MCVLRTHTAEQGDGVMFVHRQDVCVSGDDLRGASRAGLGEKGCGPCEEM